MSESQKNEYEKQIIESIVTLKMSVIKMSQIIKDVDANIEILKPKEN